MRQHRLVQHPHRLIIEELAHPQQISRNQLQRPVRRIYNLGARHTGIRDAIIENVRYDYSDTSFATPFIIHLQKIGPTKLDAYSEILFDISEYNVILTFRMTRDEPDEMTYTLPDLTMDPDSRLVEKAPRPSMLSRLFRR